MEHNLIYVDATDRFLSKLENVADPEEKRKIIGGEFIRVFEEEARKLDGIDFLGQGTIYPDIVESGTKRQQSYIKVSLFYSLLFCYKKNSPTVFKVRLSLSLVNLTPTR